MANTIPSSPSKAWMLHKLNESLPNTNSVSECHGTHITWRFPCLSNVSMRQSHIQANGCLSYCSEKTEKCRSQCGHLGDCSISHPVHLRAATEHHLRSLHSEVTRRPPCWQPYGLNGGMEGVLSKIPGPPVSLIYWKRMCIPACQSTVTLWPRLTWSHYGLARPGTYLQAPLAWMDLQPHMRNRGAGSGEVYTVWHSVWHSEKLRNSECLYGCLIGPGSWL